VCPPSSSTACCGSASGLRLGGLKGQIGFSKPGLTPRRSTARRSQKVAPRASLWHKAMEELSPAGPWTHSGERPVLLNEYWLRNHYAVVCPVTLARRPFGGDPPRAARDLLVYIGHQLEYLTGEVDEIEMSRHAANVDSNAQPACTAKQEPRRAESRVRAGARAGRDTNDSYSRTPDASRARRE